MKVRSIALLTQMLLLLWWPLSTEGQEKLRMIHEDPVGNPPVEIVGHWVGNKAFDRGTGPRHGIVAGPQWINDLVVDVKNASGKDITYIDLQVEIAKTGDMVTNGLTISFTFGNKLASELAVHNDPKIPFDVLKPNAVAKLRMSDLVRTKTEKYLGGYAAQDIDSLKIGVHEVHFSDGTGWNLGLQLLQDPLAPQKWQPKAPGTDQKFQRSTLVPRGPISTALSGFP